jgi:hypothetical protein
VALNTAGVTAILEDGNEAVIYVALGDGPLSTDQVSAARVLVTSTVAAAVITASSVPYAYTGTPDAAATHALLFSAATSGTFYGYDVLSGDQTIGPAGTYNLTALTIAGISDQLATAGLTALLNDGNDWVAYAAIGDGATSADQASTARVLVVWNTATGAVTTTDGTPLEFTGTPDADATHVLLFSAATAGTFYGAAALTGDTAFNADGAFTITELSITASGTPPVPTAAYALGIEVGVPTGTSLTTRTSLGSPTATESYVLTHPITGATNTITVSVWRHINFTQTITPQPGSGNHYRFDECSFTGQGNWCVEIDQSGRTNDIMVPLAVFTSCSFDGGAGGGLTDKCLLGGSAWVIDCDMRNAEDGWSGWYYNVAINSNFVGLGPTVDLHSDGAQCTDTGRSVFYRCWLGVSGVGGNAAMRVGTEGGADSVDIGIYYCGLSGGGYTMQMRGDSGAPDINTVTVIGNRWVDDAEFGPVDFEQTTLTAWTDNAFFDGTVIDSPV